jgi:hypothetical protein
VAAERTLYETTTATAAANSHIQKLRHEVAAAARTHAAERERDRQTMSTQTLRLIDLAGVSLCLINLYFVDILYCVPIISHLPGVSVLIHKFITFFTTRPKRKST